MNFLLEESPISGLQIIQRHPFRDSRGSFDRLFCQTESSSLLPGRDIRQINYSFTQRRGTVRGLHFQYPPHAEMKVVTCLSGRVWDVAVDLRRNSSTFLKYHAVLLSADNHRSYIIPEGFAHGFQTLSPDCEMLYFHTADYKTEAEGALNACDPKLAITWPEPITDRSERDTSHAMITNQFHGIDL